MEYVHYKQKPTFQELLVLQSKPSDRHAIWGYFDTIKVTPNGGLL